MKIKKPRKPNKPETNRSSQKNYRESIKNNPGKVRFETVISLNAKEALKDQAKSSGLALNGFLEKLSMVPPEKIKELLSMV